MCKGTEIGWHLMAMVSFWIQHWKVTEMTALHSCIFCISEDNDREFINWKQYLISVGTRRICSGRKWFNSGRLAFAASLPNGKWTSLGHVGQHWTRIGALQGYVGLHPNLDVPDLFVSWQLIFSGPFDHDDRPRMYLVKYEFKVDHFP